MAERLSGARKAAILLLSIGEEAAAEVMKNLSREEIEELTEQVTQFEDVTPGQVERVANEFYRLAEKGRFLPGTPETKTAYLKRVLGRALGEERAGSLLGGLLEGESAGALERLKWHDPHTIAEFLAKEHPQVIAVIAGNFGDPDLTHNVLGSLPEGLRQDVFGRLVRLREINPEWVTEIEASLTEELGGGKSEDPQAAANSDRVAGVLNAASTDVEANALGHIAAIDPELAEHIRRRMFPFEYFIRIDNPGMQKILERATNEDLVLALRTADEPLRRHFLRNLSPEGAAALNAAIEDFGPIRVSEIEGAQKRLSNIARALAEQGQLSILAR